MIKWLFWTRYHVFGYKSFKLSAILRKNHIITILLTVFII